MKTNATLEDFKFREKFLIHYVESQIRKLENKVEKYNCYESQCKIKPYKDILFKLTKDSKK
jgi:hypothetical protein